MSWQDNKCLTPGEIQKILAEDKPKDYPLDFYVHYLGLFLAVFFQSCRDLTELRYKVPVSGMNELIVWCYCWNTHLNFQAAENFVKYCEPIEKGEIDMSDVGKLWKHVSPHLKASLQTIYMRHETG